MAMTLSTIVMFVVTMVMVMRGLFTKVIMNVVTMVMMIMALVITTVVTFIPNPNTQNIAVDTASLSYSMYLIFFIS